MMNPEDAKAKRDSTEVESDSSVSKKQKIEDEEDDTSMEEEESDNEGLWSTDADDDDDCPRINYSNYRDPDPVWDVDSYDEHELVFDADGREGFSSDKAYAEFREYKTTCFKNRGFLDDPFRSIYPMRNLDDLWTTMTKRQYLTDIASLCVKKLNKDKDMSVEVVSIVRGNLKPGDGWKLYITFMARESPDGPLIEYQAKALDFGGKPPFPILCRRASSIMPFNQDWV